MKQQTWARREFLRVAGLAATALSLGCPPGDDTADTAAPLHPCLSEPDGAWLTPSNADVDLPHLGGAPDDQQGWTVAAFCDTVMPGAHQDPTGAPGAIDVGVPGLFFDPDLPAAAFVGLLAGFLDGVAAAHYSDQSFGTLTPDQREEVLVIALEGLDLLDLAIQLVKLGYYASRDAGCHLGYPGANPGYIDHPDFTYGVALATEVTGDGNHP